METVVIGVAGILATLSASGLGLYFTAKARSAPQREALYLRQFDLLASLARENGRARVYAVMAFDEDSPHRDRARDDLGAAVAALSGVSDDATLLLPVEVWVEIKNLTSAWVNLLVEGDSGAADTAQLLRDLDTRGAKVFLLARTLLGVDELSAEIMSYVGTRGDLERLASIPHAELARRPTSDVQAKE